MRVKRKEEYAKFLPAPSANSKPGELIENEDIVILNILSIIPLYIHFQTTSGLRVLMAEACAMYILHLEQCNSYF